MGETGCLVRVAMRLVRYSCIILLCCGWCMDAYADLKVHIISHRSRQDSDGNNRDVSGDRMVYVTGDKVRVEPDETGLIEILHCSTHDRKLYRVDMQRKQYVKGKLTLEKERDTGKGAVMRPLGKVESRTEDTGETREFFGHKARHLITHIKFASRYGDSETTQDGWYIGVYWPVNRCPVYNGQYGRAGVVGPTVNYGEGSVSFAHTGPVPDGMPVKLVQTYTIQNRTTGSNTWEVLELSEAPLDPALFEPPKGFKKVRWIINDRAQPQGATPHK
jgi:hypothetical protein